MSAADVFLTDEQRGPVLTRAASVALAAGAGCGKTTVLTERFLAEIDGAHGRALRSLAVMTFTDKAARELRQRIRGRCRARLAAGTDPDWWAAVLLALEAAPIGTFHEFCGRLLRGRAETLDLDPEFAVLDDVVAGALRERAVGQAIRVLLSAPDPDLIDLAVPHSLRGLRESLEKTLANRTPDEVDPLCDLAPPAIVARWEDAWNARGRPAALARLAPTLRACRRVLATLADAGPKLAGRGEEVWEAIDAVESRGLDADLDRLREVARIADLRGKNDWPNPDVKERVKVAFAAVREEVDKVRARLVWDPAVTLQSAAETAMFARVAHAARGEYDELKARRQGLDFSDLIVLARDALRAPGAAPADPDAEPIEIDPAAVDFVLVDEFQDTDEVQSDVLRLLAGDGFHDGRMFVVGDAKQSIYRFRGAEPAVFGRWRREFPAAGRLRLSENFRTVPRVVHFVNALFADSFADPGAAPDPDAVRLSPRRGDHSEAPAVHFLWTPPPEPEGDEKPEKPSARECRRREADALARWLRARIDAGWTVIDRDSRAPRPAHAGDVALLFRAMTDVWPYEQALVDQGFDYHTVGGSAFYSQQEVLDVVDLLSAIEDPFDQTALAGSLRGPFFALGDEALYWLTRSHRGLARELERADETPGLSDRDRDRALRARDLLRRWRALKDRAAMADLLTRAIDESGFSAALVCEFLGPRKLANVRKLIETAREFDRQGGFGLADFVGRLRAFADDPPREEQAATSEEGGASVRIMSVHQAKGLEFPVVVLPDLNRGAGPRTGGLGFDRDLGLVLKPRPAPGDLDDSPGAGESLGWRTHQEIEEFEEREEALRLFYVAATRARDELVLSAGFAIPLEQAARSVAKLSPAMNLLWERFDGPTGRLAVDLPDGWPVPEIDVADPAAIPATEERPEARRSRLPAIVAAIRDEPPAAASAATPPRATTFLDLDAPLREETRTARLGGLIRAAAFDKELLKGADPEAVVRRLASRRTPAAGASLRADAAAWIRAWRAGDFIARLRDARKIHLEARWTLPGPPVVLGSRDALAFAADDRRHAVTILAPGESPAWALLRASLSSMAADVEPTDPSWLVSVGPDGELAAERVGPIPDSRRDRLIREMTGAAEAARTGLTIKA